MKDSRDIPPESTKHCQFTSIKDEYHSDLVYSQPEGRRPYRVIDGEPFYSQEEVNDYLSKWWVEEKSEPYGSIFPPTEGVSFSLEQMKETEQGDAAWFCDIFKPYLNKYAKASRKKGELKWPIIYRRMGLKHLQEIIARGQEFGWFTSIRTPVIGLDLDFHHIPGGGWTQQGEARPCLWKRYEAIVDRMGRYPTLVCRSPSGLHIYFILQTRLHHDHLKVLIEEKLAGLVDLEYTDILPSPGVPLRIPIRKWILDPETLNPLCPRKTDSIPWGWISQRIFQIEDFFGGDYASRLREFSRNSKHTGKKPQEGGEPSDMDAKMEKIHRAEADLLPFSDFQSNDILKCLVPKYRGYGMTEEEATERIQMHLENSPEYTRSLLKPEVLANRIKRIYAIDWEEYEPSTSWNVSLPDNVEKIIATHIFVKQRTRGVRKYFVGLLSWKKYHDRALWDKAFLAYMDDMYKYYAVNRKRGLYPLPATAQERWNRNYHSILKWLLEIEVLKDSGYGYDPRRGICKWYEIHL